ncbi:MAG: flavodoxin family protein [Deltaproteobacteria bacterium]|nr:flavodoxin family protein [Deltaproteobacteria bacterium]
MKVIAFNGSPRKEGNTFLLINRVFEELEKQNIKTELVQLGGNQIRGCKACYICSKNKDNRCAQNDDMINDCIAKMAQSDGIIIGSPTYVTDVSPEVKALIDRGCLVSRANNHLLKYKAGAAVLAVRRAGSLHAFDTINHFFTINQMMVVGSIYWNLGIGRDIGEVKKDEEGMKTMEVLGQNMAWLIKKICAQ